MILISRLIFIKSRSSVWRKISYWRWRSRRPIAYGITTEDWQNFDSFMALELYEHALDGISGRFFHNTAFSVNKQVLAAFEEKFPHKEKMKTETQF